MGTTGSRGEVVVDEPIELETVIETSASGLTQAQRLQREYDEVGWRVDDSAADKYRHIMLHLARTLGLLAGVAEQHDHRLDAGDVVTDQQVADDIEAEIGRIADLVSYAAQVATIANKDLGAVFLQRLADNAARWAPGSELNLSLSTREM
jgi:hypothetical protein